MNKEQDKKEKDEHGKHVLELTINGKHYHWHQQYITGVEIRNLGNIPLEDEIFLAVKKPWVDEQIEDETKVNLARPEIEHFYSKAKDVVIIVNGTPHNWSKLKIEFKEVIILAYGQYIDKPTMIYTVAYEDGPLQNHEGSMIKNQDVFVKNKMIFHATATDKS